MLSDGVAQVFRLTAATTFTMPTVVDGCLLVITVRYEGNFAPTFSAVEWAGGTPTFAQTDLEKDILTFYGDLGEWIGSPFALGLSDPS